MLRTQPLIIQILCTFIFSKSPFLVLLIILGHWCLTSPWKIFHLNRDSFIGGVKWEYHLKVAVLSQETRTPIILSTPSKIAGIEKNTTKHGFDDFQSNRPQVKSAPVKSALVKSAPRQIGLKMSQISPKKKKKKRINKWKLCININ